jgi:tetratricopeptide (TPR) repeat protein
VAAAAIAAAWPSRDGGFLNGDDQRLVVEHYLVNHPSWAGAAELLTIRHDDLYQPLPMLSFQLDYASAPADPSGRWPVAPRRFHQTNILLHAACAILAMLVALEMARCLRVALLTGLLFAVHPFAVEPVAWINGRMILLATLFALVALLACRRRPDDGTGLWPIRAIVAWIASAASKIVPTAPIAAAWCDLRSGRRVPRRVWRVYGVMLFIGVVLGAMAWSAGSSIGIADAAAQTSSTPRLAHWILALRYYVENYFWPDRLAAWSPPPQSVALWSISVMIGALELLAFAVVAWWSRRRLPLVTTGLVLFVLLLLPFLAATGSRWLLAADRYMYLPSLGMHLAVATGVVAALDRIAHRQGRLAARIAVGSVVTAALVGMLLMDHRLAATWTDAVARDKRVVDVWPDSPAARAELVKANLFEGRPVDAWEVAEAARIRWPDDARLTSAGGRALRRLGRHSEALELLREAVARMPDHLRTQYDLAAALHEAGDIEAARQTYLRITERHSGYAPAWIMLARSYESTGDAQAAADAYEKAIDANPHDTSSRMALAVIYIGESRWKDAINELEDLLQVEPDHPPARINLAVCMARSGKPDSALAIYDRLVADHPDDLLIRINRAALLASLERWDDAATDYQFVLAAQPCRADAMIGMHDLLQAQRRYADLVSFWESCERKMDNPAIWRAWWVWANVLMGEEVDFKLDRPAENKFESSTAFERWAMAFAALRRGSDTAALEILANTPLVGPDLARRGDEIRCIQRALSSLPASVRNSRSGVIALAQSFAYGGDRYGALAVIDRLKDNEQTEHLRRRIEQEMK